MRRLRSRKVRWLLALLALRHDAPVERAWLAATLWPHSAGDQALARLRENLKDLRRALGPEAPRLRSATLHTLCLDLTDAEVDLTAFDECIARRDLLALEKAVALYRGPLLEGCTEAWAFPEREAREQAYLAAREMLAQQALASGDLAGAERHLRLAVAVDPLRESAQRELMRSLATAGNHGAALRIYEDLRLCLHRELHAAPDPATTCLAEQIRSVAGYQGHGMPRAARRRSNLPALRTSLLGREAHVEAARRLLAEPSVGLVTLTGPAGVGKTRLALEVAGGLVDVVDDGIFWVNLAPVRETVLVISAIASALGVRETDARPVDESLERFLRGKRLLLLLDNFEQILAAAPRIAELLEGSSGLKILVTSRAPLRLRAERELAVPPLALPNRGNPPSLASLMQNPAVALFCERSQSVKPGFAVTEKSGLVIAEICRMLDGLPLAIELAAARSKLLAPEALLARVEKRLQVLTVGPRDLPTRQQTLRDAIGWSYDLLDDAEQGLFRRLSVFVGGFSLEAAETVCPVADHRESPMLNLMASLVDKNMVQPTDGPNTEPRFRLLETMREYGQERLTESGETKATRQQHARYFAELSERIRRELQGPMQGEWLARLDAEHDNVRAAIEESIASGETEIGMRLCSALSWFWQVRGFLTEGRARLARVLALPGAQEQMPLRVRVLGGAGALAMEQGDYASSRAFFEEGLAIRRELGDRSAIAWVLNNLGTVAFRQGDYSLARAQYEESLAIWRELGEPLGGRLNNLANVLVAQREYDEARAHYEEYLAFAREMGNRQAVAGVLLNLGIVAFAQGQYARASALHGECLAINRELGNRQPMSDPLNNLGSVALRQENYEVAEAHFVESLTICHELGDKPRLASSLEGLAAVAGARGQHERAARLLGAAECLREMIGAPILPAHRRDHEQQIAETRSALGEERFQTGLAAGRAMTLEDAVACALD